MRVLYVEDDKGLREPSARSFGRNYPDDTLYTAVNYREAADFLMTYDYDVIFSDFSYRGIHSAISGGVDLYQLAVRTQPTIDFYFISATNISTIMAHIRGLPEYATRPPAGIIQKPDMLITGMRLHLKNLAARPGASKISPEFPQP